MITRVLLILFIPLMFSCNKSTDFMPVKESQSSDSVSTSDPSSGGTSGSTPVSVTEKFSQTERKKLDVLWIIDNSGSMGDEQTELAKNFDAFIHGFIGTEVDFKMAITTTDTSSADKKGKIVAGSDTKLTFAKAQENPTQFMADFEALVKVGTKGSGNEKGLEASEGFVDKYAASFLRPDAYLAVVLVSDEEDQSPKSPGEYVDYLKTFKADPGLVKFYSICDVNSKNTDPKAKLGCQRYKKASDLTAGTVSDISMSFYGSLIDMGDSIMSLLDSFPLSSDPVAGSLVVKVNGVVSTDYSFDAGTRSVKFTAGKVPPVGAEIVVEYLK